MTPREAKVLDDVSRNGRLGTGTDDLRLKALTMAVLALLFSPFFPISIPLAHLALSRNKQNLDHRLATKVLAVLALILSYVGILVLAFLAAKTKHHSQ
jgi:ABC-type phosphate/phosphonate transport system permease subunit